ncbi:hypothetical protein AM588_10000555 [Phytophthora nicotianae]|uniref:Uncharacterized protein n=1 Tax=Phytophthora nicotianae TaxID=4792 RepID=A0A0W8CHA2_PHYNI|nr:hypothetical protein AM588_10000555 [Phytophthora nicotianae]
MQCRKCVDSLTVELNGKKVITETEFKGFWNNLRAMTELSQDEVFKHGADMHLYPDSWYSINFSGVGGPTGDGYSNNQLEKGGKLDSTISQAQEPIQFNNGFFHRLLLAPLLLTLQKPQALIVGLHLAPLLPSKFANRMAKAVFGILIFEYHCRKWLNTRC